MKITEEIKRDPSELDLRRAAPTADRSEDVRDESVPGPAKSEDRGVADFWNIPATITANNFVYKSLSNWAFNTAVGCAHACRFCYVPSAATVKQGPALARYGVRDPDVEWGNYVLLRPWDEKKFLASLRTAERTPKADLKPDGNRAVMYCSTTDPYQVIRCADAARGRELNEAARKLVTRSLELIRDESNLNVRILTRSPLARRDFDLFKSFGPRLLFGMSLPTLNDKLARVYEPKAPSPGQRLATLRAAAEAGLHVYVAVAPTYPECDEEDLAATLEAVGAVRPVTIFHEPINIRAENVARIESHAKSLGFEAHTDVFATPGAWQDYALSSLKTVERIANDLGLGDRLHLWPDKSLGSRVATGRMVDPESHLAWLKGWWERISEWPSSGSARPLTRTSADPLELAPNPLSYERGRV
jgi:DNA repair photolyase